MQKFFKSLADKAKNVKTIDPNAIRYAGLNIRLISNMVDMLLLLMLTLPFMLLNRPQLGAMPADTPPAVVELYNKQATGQISSEEFKQKLYATGYIQQKVLPKIVGNIVLDFFIIAAIFIFFWRRYDSTPGKMLFKIKIVDDETYDSPKTGQYILRFIGYFISLIPIFIGFLMIPFSKRKRGLHDIIAGTVVVYYNALNPVWEKKKLKYQTYFMLILLVVGMIYLSQKV